MNGSDTESRSAGRNPRWDGPGEVFGFLERSNRMQVLTKRASEEVVIESVRVLVLETGADKVRFAILEPGDGFGERCRETIANSGQRHGTGVKVIAPFGEEIEIDG
jgi:hypothetical protein